MNHLNPFNIQPLRHIHESRPIQPHVTSARKNPDIWSMMQLGHSFASPGQSCEANREPVATDDGIPIAKREIRRVGTQVYGEKVLNCLPVKETVSQQNRHRNRRPTRSEG
jgi:hypothetical protein